MAVCNPTSSPRISRIAVVLLSKRSNASQLRQRGMIDRNLLQEWRRMNHKGQRLWREGRLQPPKPQQQDKAQALEQGAKAHPQGSAAHQLRA